MASLLSSLKEKLLGGPNDWEARLLDACTLVSPEGQEFTPKWIGDPRSVARKLGVFEYPKINGAFVQDLNAASVRYNLTLYFDGKDNDRDAFTFFRTCTLEKGIWSITHPVHGDLKLQLVSVTEEVQPITSGGITQFATEWIEPIDPVTLEVPLADQQDIAKGVTDLNDTAVGNFADAVTQASELAVNTIEDASTIVTGVMDNALAPLFQTLDALDNVKTALQGGIQDIITGATINLEALAGQIQALGQWPSRAKTNSQAKADAMADAIDGISQAMYSGSVPSGTDPDVAKNQAATLELGTMALIGGLAEVAQFSSLTTRQEAIDLAERLGDIYTAALTGLDNAQEAFLDRNIEDQFVSQSASYGVATKLMETVTQYLIGVAPELKIERRFVLDRPRAPIEIVLSEYGTLGDNEENLDLFIEANGLKNYEILLLDRGTEVIVYV